jgi:hypothetical protein
MAGRRRARAGDVGQVTVLGGLWRRGWFRAVVIVAAALVLAVATALQRTSGPPVEEAVERAGLHPWSMLGCYALRLGTWGASPVESASTGDTVSAPGSDLTAGAAELLSSVAAPSEVMLLSDSVDRWGRVLPSYRGAALPISRDAATSLRWFVRADTLWLLWSGRGVRAGAALLETGDGLRGRARALGDADSLDASAPATAWPVNCSTLAPESAPECERR